MIRLAASLLLLLASVPCNAGSIHPRRAYVGLYTGLGAASGGALGIALGGLQRSGESNDSAPLIKWGLGGALFGGVIGYEVARDELISADRPTSALRPGISGPSACMGAILGQIAALGISAAQHSSLDWDSRSVWANIALGTLLGASIGSVLPGLRIIGAPPLQSHEQHDLSRDMSRMEPLLPERLQEIGSADEQVTQTSPISPAPSPNAIMALDSSLLATEKSHLIDQSSIVFGSTPRSRDTVYSEVNLGIPTAISSIVYLALLEGAMLGGAAAGATGDASDDFTARAAVGGALGALAGLSAGASFVRPWNNEEGKSISAGESIALGERVSGTLTGGLAGCILGAALGATLRNSVDGFDSRDASGLALAGNLAGLLAGAILTGQLQPH